MKLININSLWILIVLIFITLSYNQFSDWSKWENQFSKVKEDTTSIVDTEPPLAPIVNLDTLGLDSMELEIDFRGVSDLDSFFAVWKMNSVPSSKSDGTLLASGGIGDTLNANSIHFAHGIAEPYIHQDSIPNLRVFVQDTIPNITSTTVKDTIGDMWPPDPVSFATLYLPADSILGVNRCSLATSNFDVPDVVSWSFRAKYYWQASFTTITTGNDEDSTVVQDSVHNLTSLPIPGKDTVITSLTVTDDGGNSVSTNDTTLFEDSDSLLPDHRLDITVVTDTSRDKVDRFKLLFLTPAETVDSTKIVLMECVSVDTSLGGDTCVISIPAEDSLFARAQDSLGIAVKSRSGGTYNGSWSDTIWYGGYESYKDWAADDSIGAAYLCDEADSTANLADTSGNNYDLTQNSSPGVTTGKYGNCRILTIADGGDFGADYAELDYDGTHPITIAAWVNLYSINDERALSQNTEIVLRVSSNKAEFILNSFGGDDRATGATNVGTGAWKHIAGTYDGDSIRVYLDGVKDGAVKPTGTYGTADQTWQVSLPSPSFAGKVDEIIVLGRALSLSEITELKDHGIKGDQ